MRCDVRIKGRVPFKRAKGGRIREVGTQVNWVIPAYGSDLFPFRIAYKTEYLLEISQGRRSIVASLCNPGGETLFSWRVDRKLNKRWAQMRLIQPRGAQTDWSVEIKVTDVDVPKES